MPRNDRHHYQPESIHAHDYLSVLIISSFWPLPFFQCRGLSMPIQWSPVRIDDTAQLIGKLGEVRSLHTLRDQAVHVVQSGQGYRSIRTDQAPPELDPPEMNATFDGCSWLCLNLSWCAILPGRRRYVGHQSQREHHQNLPSLHSTPWRRHSEEIMSSVPLVNPCPDDLQCNSWWSATSTRTCSASRCWYLSVTLGFCTEDAVRLAPPWHHFSAVSESGCEQSTIHRWFAGLCGFPYLNICWFLISMLVCPQGSHHQSWIH